MKTKCAVNGILKRGAMCGSVIVGGQYCGQAEHCEHQRKESPVADAIAVLKAEGLQFLVVENSGKVVAMNLSDNLFDLNKLTKSFKVTKC